MSLREGGVPEFGGGDVEDADLCLDCEHSPCLCGEPDGSDDLEDKLDHALAEDAAILSAKAALLASVAFRRRAS